MRVASAEVYDIPIKSKILKALKILNFQGLWFGWSGDTAFTVKYSNINDFRVVNKQYLLKKL